MDKVIVTYSQNYDVIEFIHVISEDKFEDYIKDFENNIVPEHNLEGKYESMEIDRRKDSINWKIVFTDEYISKVYHWMSLEDVKKGNHHITYHGFDYFITDINDYYFKNKS